MPEGEIIQQHYYRLEFPLSDKPVEKRRFELMRKVNMIQKEIKNKGFHDVRGLKQLTCYAPYSNFAVCFAATEGETEWLPDVMQQIRKDEKITKKEPDFEKIWIQKTFIPMFIPTPRKLRAEKDWFESIQKVKKGIDITTKEAEEKLRGEVEKKKE
jgi:hypothetical protein